jgi:RsiW-degrading membrane proteinase PrsW (M82 family)
VVSEVVLSAILSLIQNVVVLVIIIIELDGNEDIPMDRDSKAFQTFLKDFSKNHLWLFVVFVFFNAYLVAALTEELSKYYGYFMVEHDDLAVGGGRDQVSIGAGISVAMVATALGFACCENLLYVFVYTPPSMANEVATLLARSLFPVHPLAAAIQSIGVCRRDLEKDKKWRLGRIVLPAVLLHGSFDFSLMVMALFQQSSSDDEQEDGEDAQQIRLEALDQPGGHHRGAEDSPLLV